MNNLEKGLHVLYQNVTRREHDLKVEIPKRIVTGDRLVHGYHMTDMRRLADVAVERLGERMYLSFASGMGEDEIDVARVANENELRTLSQFFEDVYNDERGIQREIFQERMLFAEEESRE